MPELVGSDISAESLRNYQGGFTQPDRIEGIGFKPDQAENIASRLETKQTYEKAVLPRRKRIQSIRQVTKLINGIKAAVNPTVQQGQASESSAVYPQDTLIRLAQSTNINPDLAKQSLFGSEGQQDNPGLIAECRSIWGSMAPQEVKMGMINKKIGHVLNQWYAGRDDLKPLTSEHEISVKNSKGETVKTTPKRMFELNLERFSERAAFYEARALDVLMSDPDLATYATFEWTKEVGKQIAERNMDIFPTPDTQMVKDQIAVAMNKRNGLLKCILYGGAGVGKTRLIQEVDREMGKEKTVVINFHHFISFEELIGQTAVSVNLGQGSTKDQLGAVVDRFVDSDPSSDMFWKDMSGVYTNLPEVTKQKFSSVEEMVRSFVPGDSVDNTDETSAQDQNRESIMNQFQTRIKAMRDMTILGIDGNKEGNLASRWVEGVIVKAITEGQGKVSICFDEMDKAGPHAIEGLLSFLSLSPGQTWNYQGGSLQIPEDFYVTATSNRTNIGSPSESDKMNEFLADRTEGILVKPQSVKSSLMIAAAHLSDGRGGLLLDTHEQSQLVNALSYVIPELQISDLPMPISNRVLKTICSRLVDYRVNEKGERRPFRVISPQTGKAQSVYEALNISLLEMKQIALGTNGINKVRNVLESFKKLLGGEQVSYFGEDLQLDDISSEFQTDEEKREATLDRRAAVVESIWRQPLYEAAASLQIEPISGKVGSIEVSDANLLNLPNLGEIASRAVPLDLKKMGRNNGIQTQLSAAGIFLQGNLPSETASVVSGNFEGGLIESASQLGGTMIVRSSDDEIHLIASGWKMSLDGSTGDSNDVAEPKNDATLSGLPVETSFIVDPLGRYYLSQNNAGCDLNVIYWKKTEAGFQLSTQTLNIGKEGVSIEDLTSNGQQILLKNQSGHALVDLSQLLKIDAGSYDQQTGQSVISSFLSARQIPAMEAPKASFLGNDTVIGLNDQNLLVSDNSGVAWMATVS